MSNVPIKDAEDNTRKVDVFTRTEGPDVVETQAVAVVDPASGQPLDLATEATVTALLTAAQAIQAAAEALNAKTTAVNTGAIAGTVALDAPSLAALENVTVSNMVAPGLTDQQLRANPVPVNAASLGEPDNAPATDDSGTFSLIALIKRGLSQWSSLASAVRASNSPFSDGDKGIFILGKRRDSDTTIVADGDYAGFNFDENARLKVSSQPASYPDTTGVISASGQTVFANVDRASNVTISMVGASLVGHNSIFEYSNNSTNGSDGTWYNFQAARSNANTADAATGVLAATPAYGWEASVNAYKWIRVRATAHTSGSATYIIKQGTYATEPVPIVQVTGNQPITHAGGLAASTARIGFITSAGVGYDDSSTVLAANATFTGTARDITVTASGTGFNNASTFPKEVRISAESDQAGTLWLEVSLNGTSNWRRIKAVPTAAVAGGGQYAEIIHRPSWRYMRAGFTNGAAPQARFSISTFLIAN